MKKLNYNFVKTMKVHGFKFGLLLAGLLLFVLSGCSRYQYIAVAGDTHQNKAENFVVENDTAKIVYSFNGFNFPVKVEVYNKLNKPLYVDWTKSAIIIDGQTLSYWQNKAQFSGSTDGTSMKLWDGVYYSWGNMSGTISKHEKVSFIPPGSYVKTTRFHLRRRLFDTKSSESVKSGSFTSPEGKVWGWNDKFTFNKAGSPFKFKSYITMSTDKDFSRNFHFTSSFWVNHITQTEASPNQLQDKNFPKTYLQRSTTGGLILGTIVTLGIITAGLALLK